MTSFEFVALLVYIVLAPHLAKRQAQVFAGCFILGFLISQIFNLETK